MKAFTATEEKLLRESLARDPSLSCPRCHRELTQVEVPPRRDVSYVRNRVWLQCPACDRAALVDRPAR